LIARLFVLLCWLIIFGGLGFGGWLYKSGRLKNFSVRSLMADRDRLTTEQILIRNGPSVALIRGRKGQGSGFVVRGGLVVTNLPWIANDPPDSIDISFPTAPPESRGPFPCKTVYRDKIRDIAFLLVDSTMPPLTLDGSTESKSGREVVVIGSPGLDVKTPENTAIAGVIEDRVGSGFQEYEKISATITPENNGGPVVDWKGRVVGLVQVISPQEKGVLCVPSAEILLAIDRRFDQAETVEIEQASKKGESPTLAGSSLVYGSADVLLAQPVIMPDASPALRIAICDYGKFLPSEHPNVRASAALLDSAKLLFRQDDAKITDLVIDMIANLRARGTSARAMDALQALVEFAPAPSPENLEEKNDAREYLVIYFESKLQSKIQAEALLVMRKSVEEMLKQRQKPADEKPVAEKAEINKLAEAQAQAPVVANPPIPAAPNNNPPAGNPPQAPPPPQKPQPIIQILRRKGKSSTVPVAFERESVLKLQELAGKDLSKAEIYAARSVDFFPVKDGTQVEELEEEAPDDVASRVRILEGDKNGRMGWVPKKFLHAPPNQAAVWLQSAKLLDAKKARSWYERIVEKYPDSPEAKEAKKALDAMPKLPMKP
jgi:hypothetical protein